MKGFSGHDDQQKLVVVATDGADNQLEKLVERGKKQKGFLSYFVQSCSLLSSG